MKNRDKNRKNTVLFSLAVIILASGLVVESAYATTLLVSRWQQSVLNWQQAKSKYFTQQSADDKEDLQAVLAGAANLLISYLQIMQQELNSLKQGQSVSFLLSSLGEFSDWWQGQLQHLITVSDVAELKTIVDSWQKRWEATKILSFKAGGRAALMELAYLNERLTALGDRLKQAEKKGVLPADWQQFSSQEKQWQGQMEQAQIALNLADSVLSQVEITNGNSQELFYQFLVHLITAKDSLVRAAEILAQSTGSQLEIIQAINSFDVATTSIPINTSTVTSTPTIISGK